MVAAGLRACVRVYAYSASLLMMLSSHRCCLSCTKNLWFHALLLRTSASSRVSTNGNSADHREKRATSHCLNQHTVNTAHGAKLYKVSRLASSTYSAS